MEAAYDKNNSNNAFDNESSHFKFNNMDGGFNISPDIPVSNDAEDCQMITPPTLLKNSYNESNDVLITDESVDVVDNHQRFEDDFGPETDVDAMDETNFIKSPVEPQANENNNEFCLSNGVKPLSLENKIMQQLSEQNRDLLTDSNPFKNDHFDHFSDDHVILPQTTDDSAAEVVDNKIIDALESLVVSNGENEKHEFEDEKQEGDLLDIRPQSPDIPDATEKADYVHEKNLFMLDSAAKPDDTFMQHSDDQAEQQKPLLIEQEATPSLADTRCVDESVGEDSEEEEDEWNYIKGDKKSEEKHNSSSTEIVEESVELPEIYSSESVEKDQSTISNVNIEQQLVDFNSEEPTQKDEKEVLEEEVFTENEKVDETKDDIEEAADSIAETEELVQETLEEQLQDTAVSIEQELADYENNASTLATSEVVLPSENSEPVSSDENRNQETGSPNLLLKETSSSELEPERPLSPEIDAEDEGLCTEAVVEENPSTDFVAEEEAPSAALEPEHTPSMSVVDEDTPSTEIAVEEASIEKQTIEDQLSDIAKESSVDEELERPDSLSFEMASKLNPEAKEFVPVSSPTRSNPTSPVANAPSMIPNSFLMLDDDAVVAQSPKKSTTTMDNIDVPAEVDFQQEMSNRPHELEKPSEYINGNADASARSHSPVSEQSYQELNLKEAMQADEKLEHDYNDEKQVVTEDSPSDIPSEENLLNVLNKEQDPMNMSFYEGRDEGLLSNSDELNKVHMLPDVEDEIEELSNDDTDKVQADTHELTPTEPAHVQLLEEKNIEVTIPESASLPADEEEMQSKSPAPEEAPSAAIYAVASQVVNDVAALVDQMQIESPIVNDNDLNHGEEQHLQVPADISTEITTDDVKLDENRDILISLEHQNEVKPLEDVIDTELHAETPSPNPVENLHAVEMEDLVSPLVESVQQEVVAENEFITDESVLNVQSPTKCMFSPEASIETEPALEEIVKEPVTTDNLAVESVAEFVETPTSSNLLETPVTPVPEPLEATPVDIPAKAVEEVTPAVAASLKSVTTKPAAKSSATKPAASKTTTAKTATKPVSSTVEKKTTSAKLNATAKPAATKPSTTAKPPATSTVKKTSTVSSAPSNATRTTGAAKSPASSTMGRSSTAGSAASKLSTERKAPSLAAKRPPTTAVNGEAKVAPAAARKPMSAATTLKSSTTARSSATSSSSTSATSARPSSASARSTTTAKPATTTKTTASVSARSTTTTTARTSSTVPTAKPRTVPSTASKTASSTTTTSTNKTSSSTITKRVSTVGATPAKTTAATTKSTSAAVKTTSTVASRSSTASKVSSTTVGGMRKTTTASPTKKPVSSPAGKPIKAASASTKIVSSNHTNGKISSDEAAAVNTTDLLDLDKQFKNDNNELITKNGIDSQMMVIDSAAD